MKTHYLHINQNFYQKFALVVFSLTCALSVLVGGYIINSSKHASAQDDAKFTTICTPATDSTSAASTKTGAQDSDEVSESEQGGTAAGSLELGVKAGAQGGISAGSFASADKNTSAASTASSTEPDSASAASSAEPTNLEVLEAPVCHQVPATGAGNGASGTAASTDLSTSAASSELGDDAASFAGASTKLGAPDSTSVGSSESVGSSNSATQCPDGQVWREAGEYSEAGCFAGG